jgi:hypothetical protein
MVGPISPHLDATGILLDMADRETAAAVGHRVLEQGQ